MRNFRLPLLILTIFLSVSHLFPQTIKLNVVTARGKTTVFADTVYAANIEATVATSNGYFRLHFTSPNFDGAFNVPLFHKGILGVDNRIQPTFLRKDAHFTGVVTIKREKDKLILLTKPPKDVPEQESEIYSGVWGDDKREQKFSGEFRYQSYTYDEQKFIKRDFIVQIRIDMPITIAWNTVKRKWVPESLPDKLDEVADEITISDEPMVDSLITQPEPADTTGDSLIIQPEPTPEPADTTVVEDAQEVGSVETLLEPAQVDSAVIED